MDDRSAMTLISSLIAATVALFTFALTHWLQALRGRSDFLRTKIEDLYLSLDTFIPILRKLGPHFTMADDKSRDHISDVAADLIYALHRPHMLCSLYFTDFQPRMATIVQQVRDIAEILRKLLSNRMQIEDAVEQSGDLTDQLALAIRELRVYLLDNYKDHIRTPSSEVRKLLGLAW